MSVAEAKGVHEVDAKTAAGWLESGEAVLVDVREDYEHASESVEGSVLVPLTRFDLGEVRDRCGSKRAVFSCRSGRRARDAAERFAGEGGEAFCLRGGIEGWKAAGLGVTRAAGGPRLDVMRQVQVTAGSLVVIGVALGVLVSPWALVLSGFVGCGLVFAGLSGWCGMARLLGRMPWNRVGC